MKKILLAITFGFLSLSLLIAQENKSYQIIQKSEKGVPSFIRFDANTDVNHENFFEKLKDEFGFQADDKFLLLKTTKDKMGFTHYKYNQQYKGIVVHGVQYIIHEKNAVATAANGKFIPTLSLNINPTVSKDEAVKKAETALNLGKYKWQDENLEKELKERTKNPKASYYPKPSLVLEPLYGNYKTGEFRLCWKFTVEGIKLTDAWIVFIDAQTGRLINKISQIHNADVTGTLNTYYYGPQSIQCAYDTPGLRYVLAEVGTRGPNQTQQIIDIDFNHTAIGQSPVTSAITDNSLSFSSYPVAVGAHWQ